MARSYVKATTMATGVLLCQLLILSAPSLIAIPFKSSAVACAVLYRRTSFPDKRETAKPTALLIDAVVEFEFL